MFTVNKSNIALRGLGYSSKTSFPSLFACLSCVGPSVRGVPVKVGGHLAGVSSFLQPRESWALNLRSSDLAAGVFTADPYRKPKKFFHETERSGELFCPPA